MNRIVASGLVILVTLTLGAYAQQVDVVPDTSCPNIQPDYGSSCPLLSFNETCTYGEICCPDDGGACLPETTCFCDSGSSNWYCYEGGGETIPCPSMCPETPPDTFDTCDFDSRFSCVYGDEVVCDESGMTFESEQECFCYEGQYLCTKNICPVACPATQPIQGETCSPFIDYFCYYDEVCCPDDGGACAPQTTCYCDNATSYCYEEQLWASIPCNSVCPDAPPISYVDSCDIDSRFKCTYGEPFYCNSTGMMYESERECYCAEGTFACYANECPIPCPVVKPSDGDACLPFVDYYCSYGELCCPGDTNEPCVPDKTCYCQDSVVTCFEGGSEGSLPCPTMCPETPPDTFDTCDIDSRFSCVYGDAVVCDESGWEYEHEKECFCMDGHFYCTTNACPVACPATQPVEGEVCTPFMDYYCSYDEFCCPGEDGDVCVPKTQCYCNSNMTITCYEPSIICPSVCPTSQPTENDSSLCTIDERYVCKYENGTCESPYDFGETTCTCASDGLYECSQNCMSVDYEYDDIYDDDAIDNVVPMDSNPLENSQNPPETVVVAEDVEPRSTSLDEAESHDPSNGKKKKKQKHANMPKKEEKKDGKTRTLLRS